MYEVVASVFRVEELHGSDSPQGSSVCVCGCVCVCVCVCVGGCCYSFFFFSPPLLQFLQVKIYLLQYNMQCSVIKKQKCWQC